MIKLYFDGLGFWSLVNKNYGSRKIMTAVVPLDAHVHLDDKTNRFWSYQFAQDCQLLHAILDAGVVPKLKEEAGMLYAGWFCMLQKPCPHYNPVATNSQFALLSALYNLTTRGYRLTEALSLDDFQFYICHMLFELTFYVRLAQDRICVKDELNFWFQEAAEHTTLVARLLPLGPLKTEAVRISSAMTKMPYITEQSNLSEYYDLYVSSNKAAQSVYEGILDGSITTVPKEVLEHEIREGQRGQYRMYYITTGNRINID